MSRMYISIDATRWVFEHSKSERSARLVLLAIAAHCNDDGQCWPGLEALARYSGLSRTRVLQSVEELEKLGEITVERGGKGPGDTNHYYLKAFMDLRVHKGKENSSKGALSPQIRVQTGVPEEVSLEETIKNKGHINLVNQAIEESHRTHESADVILKRLKAEAAA